MSTSISSECCGWVFFSFASKNWIDVRWFIPLSNRHFIFCSSKKNVFKGHSEMWPAGKSIWEHICHTLTSASLLDLGHRTPEEGQYDLGFLYVRKLKCRLDRYVTSCPIRSSELKKELNLSHEIPPPSQPPPSSQIISMLSEAQPTHWVKFSNNVKWLHFTEFCKLSRSPTVDLRRGFGIWGLWSTSSAPPIF